MYKEIINKVKELGDILFNIEDEVLDIGKRKNWLTEWDIKIEQELTNLIKTFPGEHNIFAEEISNIYIESENVWIIDPISSTFNFIHGLPHYAIVLSHLYKGEVVFAVVYDPSNKELFTAEKNKGTYLNDKLVKVSDRTKDLSILMGGHLTPTGLYREDTIKMLDKLSTIGTIRMIGSLGLHYSYVACGRADMAISLNRDVFPEFAGKLLVEEAGGIFTDLDGNKLNVTTHGIFTSNGKITREALK